MSLSSTNLRAAGACLCALLLLQSVPVSAETKRLHDAWEDVLANSEPVLTPQQFAKLNNLAYQAAVVRVCDGFEIDTTKFRTQLSAATALADESKVSDDEHGTHSAFVLFELGTRYGLLIAEGNVTKTTFCSKATDLKKDSSVPNIWE